MFNKFLKKCLLFGLLFTVFSVVSFVGLYFLIEKDLPKITSVDDYQPSIPSIIYDRNGKILKEMGSENRAIVKIEDVPQKIINSFLAAEDSNFYHHIGIDPLGIARAFVANLKAGRVVQGGSTISQQVAKSFLISKERSIVRKIKDIFLAYKIEQFLTKNEILFLYLNQVYLGGGYYGIKEAFQGYFGKDLNEVTIAESAMIAGLLVAPSRYSPYLNPKFAYMRQKYVLSRLLSDNLITEEEYTTAVNESIKYHKKISDKIIGSYFIEFIRKEIVNRLGEERLLRGGLKIYTTLDSKLQDVSENAINDGVMEIDKRQGFSGPISKILTEEEQQKFINDERNEFKENYSNYFVIDSEYNRKLELENIFDEDQNPLASLDFYKYLEGDKFFKVFVTKIDDQAGLVFVNFMGFDGFIALGDMNWARIRNLQTVDNWKQPLGKISEVLNVGDVVLVKYISNSIEGLKIGENVRRSLGKMSQSFIQFSLFQKPLVQAASITIDPFTGEVLSMVGGNKYYADYFNRAVQSKRQPGSALKPFVYALALENGYNNASMLFDTPESLNAGAADFNWKPRNYDGKYMGPITFRTSLEQSRNVTTIKLASELGVDNFINFLNKIGLEGEYNNDLSTSLGSGAISLEKLTLGYSLFVNGGEKIATKFLVSVKDYLGNDYKEIFEDLIVEKVEELPTEGITGIEVIPSADANTVNNNYGYDKRNSFLMRSLLQGVVQNGTGKKAKSLGRTIGGKTGTTSDYNDAWFIGFSSRLVTGVWVGFDDNKTLGWSESGSKAALPIWIDIMKVGIKLYPEKEIPMPEGIINVAIDKETGKLATVSTTEPFFEVFIENSGPGLNDSGNLDDVSQQIKPNSEEDFYDLR